MLVQGPGIAQTEQSSIMHAHRTQSLRAEPVRHALSHHSSLTPSTPPATTTLHPLTCGPHAHAVVQLLPRLEGDGVLADLHHPHPQPHIHPHAGKVVQRALLQAGAKLGRRRVAVQDKGAGQNRCRSMDSWQLLCKCYWAGQGVLGCGLTN